MAKNQHAVKLGRKGGKAKSKKKSIASARNLEIARAAKLYQKLPVNNSNEPSELQTVSL